MGWNFACAVSTFCETHVIVSDEFRHEIDAYCQEHKETTQNLRFHYVDELPQRPSWKRFAEKHFPTVYFYYNYCKWLHRAAKRAEELESVENFDIVHHVTLAGFRFPGYLWRLKKPLLWGPCGGMDDAPYRLLFSLRWIDIVGYSLRNIINTYQKHFGYAARIYAGHADYILTSTEEGKRVIRRLWKRPGEYMCEIGTKSNGQENPEPAAHQPGTPLRICWAGIMSNQRKNLPLLFKALEHCHHPVELCVMGDGSQKERWEVLSRTLPPRHKVVFLGAVSHERVFSEMRRAHLFCITSVKDDTSSVLLEALQQGLPVVAPDSCGFSGVITDACGVKIRIDWPGRFARAYGETLNRLAQDETQRMELAQGALRRAEDFTWNRKTERLKEIYTALVSGKNPAHSQAEP